MKKSLSILMSAVMITAMLAACSGGSTSGGTAAPDNTAPGNTASSNEPAPPADSGGGSDAEPAGPVSTNPYEDVGIGPDGRFIDTRTITVEVFDRGLADQRTKPEDNYYSRWIQEKVLQDLNIEIQWEVVERWAEADIIPTLLAAQEAPDICVTYNYPAINEYGNMGGVLDMQPYVDGYSELLPDLWDLLGEVNIHYNQDPDTGRYWAIEAILANNSRINTFVRQDWLKKLGLSEPKTIDEFEAVLVAFKDNAQLLLGDDAGKMIPFTMGSDVGWRANNLLASFVPDAMTDKEWYVNGFDDRQFTLPGVKEGVRKLNDWYNKGLILPDFALYADGDPTEDNYSKAGFTGAMIHNWDYPYRGGEDSVNSNVVRVTGDPEAGFICIDPFLNDAGVSRKWITASVDRKVFFPFTNDEPLASAMYLNWLAKLENRMYLQIGEEGITHEILPDGSIGMISATGTDYIQNSPLNIDYTTVINGLDLGDAVLTGQSMVSTYPSIDSSYIGKAFLNAQTNARPGPHYNFGEIVAESGMGNPLKDKRNALISQSIVAKPADFDAVYDAGYQDYLSSGGQAIMDERLAAYDRFFK